MTARDQMEAATHAAITKYRAALEAGTYRKTADNQLVDAVLKAADRYALGAISPQRRRTYDGMVRDPEAQAARLRAQIANDDDPVTQAERRLALDAYAVSRRTAL